MLSTWLFIIIIGDAAQSIEVRNVQECLDLKQYVAKEIDKNDNLRGKAVVGCFRNMGERTRES